MALCTVDRRTDHRKELVTAYGTVVPHVAPEAAAGGPLAKVRAGDIVTLDVEAIAAQCVLHTVRGAVLPRDCASCTFCTLARIGSTSRLFPALFFPLPATCAMVRSAAS
ncbi:dehydratase family protein [Streptomyces sp. VMFN-G11Ma]|nr:dehydratase family protein [Streptomyces sp. VMFN-G11Ma]